MNGQWIGEFKGTYGGAIIVNIDERKANYEGIVYVLPVDRSIPPSALQFTTLDKTTKFKLDSHKPVAIHPDTGGFVEWKQVASMFPGSEMSQSVDVVGDVAEDQLVLHWKTDLGVEGSAALPSSKAKKPSQLVAMRHTWDQYKAFVASLEGRRELFRGQRKNWRLQTAYHRTGRSNLHRFMLHDLPVLHRTLSHRTKHLFNLSNNDENGAFFSLIQHHGYPTPLLDWTYSPYVAAFFAFRNVSRDDIEKAKEDDVVRIFVFDAEKWRKLGQVPLVVTAFPHVSLLEFLALENDRLLPQQSVSMLTNIDDIETYVGTMQNGPYLKAIDIPITERARVMRELRYMGITAGSMFPGLDGLCEELRELSFDVD